MFRQVDCVVKPLTRDFAEEFSQLPVFGGDRDRESTAGRKRIAWLAEVLEDGHFFSPVWSTVSYNGRTYRIDGGHSSQMLAENPGAFPEGLPCVVRQFRCESEQDLADLFSQFDNRKSLRTRSDKTKAHTAVEAQLRDLPPTWVAICVDGIAAYSTQFRGGVDEDDRTGLVHYHQGFIAWAHPFVKSRRIKRVGVVAAMYATRRVNQEAATEFWTLVRDETHPEANNPTRKLAVFLRDSMLDNRTGRSWSQRAFYAKSIHAWNAWRTGVTTALKFHYTSDLPTPK